MTLSEPAISTPSPSKPITPPPFETCRGIIAIRSIGMLIAQATVEDLAVASVDRSFAAYAVRLLPV